LTENTAKENDRTRTKAVVQTVICLMVLVALGLDIVFVGAKRG
jgi:hypothetical protein